MNYLDPKKIRTDKDIFILIEGVLNASDNFGYCQQSSQKAFSSSWCGQSRIQVCLKDGLNVLDFTLEDLYPLMDETLQIINGSLSGVSDRDTLEKILQFFLEFYRRKNWLDLFQTSWRALEARKNEMIVKLKRVEQSLWSGYYEREISKLNACKQN